MPKVRINGVTPEQVVALAPILSQKLVEITECPIEYIEIEYIPSKVVINENLELGVAFVEIYWFDRGQEQSDALAKAYTEVFQKNGIENVDIAYMLYSKSLYYENGQHF